jgi:hypothetical protein
MGPSVRRGNATPVIEDQPAVADHFGAEDAMVSDSPVSPVQPERRVRFNPDTKVQVPHPHYTRLQQRCNMADRVLTTSGVPEVRVKLSGSAVDSITAYLEKRWREGTVDPSANVSVKQAIRTRGDDAEKVIIKELTQMDVLGVWEAFKTVNMKSDARASVIRSSMFLKRKTHPCGLSALWNLGRDEKGRERLNILIAYMKAMNHRKSYEMRYSDMEL